MAISTSSLRPGTGIPSGKHGCIIQVESVKKTDTFITSNDSFVDVTGLTVDSGLSTFPTIKRKNYTVASLRGLRSSGAIRVFGI